jgi:hypothetical protein
LRIRASLGRAVLKLIYVMLRLKSIF